MHKSTKIKCFNTDLNISIYTDDEKEFHLINKVCYLLHQSSNIYDKKSEISLLNKKKKYNLQFIYMK